MEIHNISHNCCRHNNFHKNNFCKHNRCNLRYINDLAETYCHNGRMQMCAILHDKAFVHAVGYNNYIPHVNIFRKRLLCPSTHAEIDAVKQIIDTCRNPTRKRIRVDMIVFRKNFQNEYGNSKPCKHCVMLLRSQLIRQFLNIRTVTYYDNGRFVTESLEELDNDYVSTGWLNYYSSNDKNTSTNVSGTDNGRYINVVTINVFNVIPP